MSKKSKSDTYASLLERYLDVCNRVMQENRDRFPYSQIWQAGEQALSGRAIEFAVVDDKPKALKYVTLQSNQIGGPEPDELKDDPPVMRLSTSYLEEVVAHPEKYIENPSLIDWDWLQLRKS